MKKALFAIAGLVSCMTATVAMGAVTVKKAAPVATQAASTTNSAGSLVPTVLSLVSNVQQLTSKQNDMMIECVPSSAEITFVNNIVKEWAKTGAMSAKDVQKKLKRKPCAGGSGYAFDIEYNAATGLDDVCYDYFVGYGNEGMVWYGFPKVGKTEYCDDGSKNCKNKKTASDIYEIFDLVDFGYADYTKAEATMAAKLIAKVDECTDKKLSQKKREMWGEFLTTTIGGVGQKTNTSAIMDTVGGITKGGTNVSSGLSSLGSVATQFLNK
ncbi:MAG: hypothetical protein IKP05_03065 [Alphaproteobacteria bacterium]|nr:hypothetical protein [Alphaproteobacteria bacterium]